MEKQRSQLEHAGQGIPITVVIGPVGAWSPIWTQLTELTQVYSYVPALPVPVTALDLVTDLHYELHDAGAEAPYILIGSSFTGLLVQLYARLYPDDVKALILLDSVHENQVQRFYEFSKDAGDGLVAEIAEVHKGLLYDASEKQIQAAPALRRDLLLTVISRGKVTDVAPVWSALQEEMAAQSDVSTHIVATHSGHGIHFDEPDLVVAAFRNALLRARSEQ